MKPISGTVLNRGDTGIKGSNPYQFLAYGGNTRPAHTTNGLALELWMLLIRVFHFSSLQSQVLHASL